MKHNGFTVIEVIIAVSILVIVIKALMPISMLLYKERTIISERSVFSALLHDELQLFTWNDSQTIPNKYNKQMNSKTLLFEFTEENKLVKGCVNWLNVKNKKESICLYAHKK